MINHMQGAAVLGQCNHRVPRVNSNNGRARVFAIG
jgi:hypothetical protein